MKWVKSVWMVIPVWLTTVALSFWWFEYRHWRSFQSLTVTFNGQDVQQLNERLGRKGQVTIMHFVNKSCPCYGYSKSHIANLTGKLTKMNHVMIENPSALGIPATPSVAVWDQKGSLAYFGPYSSGMVCGEGNDFVMRVVQELSKSKNPQWINTAGVGCYCQEQSGVANRVEF